MALALQGVWQPHTQRKLDAVFRTRFFQTRLLTPPSNRHHTHPTHREREIVPPTIIITKHATMSQRFSLTLLVLAVVVLVTVQAKDRRADSLFGKTRQQHQQGGEAQESEAAATPGKFTFERRRMSAEEAATARATKLETGLDPDMNILK
jgi:hypothetical protein